MQLSIVLPARNEAQSIGSVVAELKRLHPSAELIVVDDGSDDDTAAIAEQTGANVVRHPYSKGNGAAVKTGAREASGEVLAIMDADGQHDPKDVEHLLVRLDSGYDMVVGARDSGSQANIGRSLGNRVYNRLASYMTGQHVADLTSGFRVVNRRKFLEFLHLLPNGFSYPTTITMAFFRAGYSVAYMPITAAPRIGHSHISPIRDGIRFLLIIFRVGTLYSPFKLFVPISLFFFLVGLAYYMFTFVTAGRFTNMSALLFTTSVLVFLIGIVSEQITTILYQIRRPGAPNS